MNADDPRHGSVNGYSNLGCRCEQCKAAWRVAHLEYMHRSGQIEKHRQREAQRRLARYRSGLDAKGQPRRSQYNGGLQSCLHCGEPFQLMKARRFCPACLPLPSSSGMAMNEYNALRRRLYRLYQ